MIIQVTINLESSDHPHIISLHMNLNTVINNTSLELKVQPNRMGKNILIIK